MTATIPALHHHQIADIALPAIADTDNQAAIQNLIERLEANLAPTAPVPDPNWYGWIPLPLGTYLENMLTARRILGPGRHRYLEIGSGIGTKLILAHELGWQTTGIERWGPYAEVSRQLAPFATIHHADAASWSDYGSSDLIYLYGIATDPSDHDAINHHITRRMRTGTLFFCARRPFPTWLEHIDRLIWRAR
jgi:hypothetical protein